MMFSVHAVVHSDSGTCEAIESRTFTFFRPYCAQTPTFLGAARMVSRSCDSRPLPRNISILRIESFVYETR